MNTVRSNVFVYRGRSMWPCFQDGDLLELEYVKLTEILPGDCIAYANPNGAHTVHRVVAVGSGLSTRGDAMPLADQYIVSQEQVMGLVTRRYRFGRATRVSRGRFGRLAGWVYRYTGRIDPSRVARGGRLARCIRRMATTFLTVLGGLGTRERLTRANEPDLVVWKFRERIVARQDPVTACWAISWPWSILLDIRNSP